MNGALILPPRSAFVKRSLPSPRREQFPARFSRQIPGASPAQCSHARNAREQDCPPFSRPLMRPEEPIAACFRRLSQDLDRADWSARCAQHCRSRLPSAFVWRRSRRCRSRSCRRANPRTWRRRQQADRRGRGAGGSSEGGLADRQGPRRLPPPSSSRRRHGRHRRRDLSRSNIRSVHRASKVLRTRGTGQDEVWCFLAAVLSHEAAHTAADTERQALEAEVAQLRRCAVASHLAAGDVARIASRVSKIESKLRQDDRR